MINSMFPACSQEMYHFFQIQKKFIHFSQKLTPFWSFEHTQNVSIFGEGLYIRYRILIVKGISVIYKRKTLFTSLLRLVQDRQNHVLKLCYIIYVLSNSVPGVSSRISSGQIKHWSVSSIILSPALKSWVATSPLVGPDPFIFNPSWTKHELSSKKSHFSSFKRASFSSSCSKSSDSVS